MSVAQPALAALLLVSAFSALGPAASGQGVAPENLMEIDASRPAAPPETGFIHLGGRSSTGHDLEINSRYLTIDGKPVLPVMGEFHFSRYPPQYWEEEILKMKAAGVNVIATYVFWIHHEEIEGQFDWSGQRDLRRFVQLCGKHGMYVYLRIGPWAHGEVRNGGFPDWLMKNTKVRTNDPDYLSHVAAFDAQIALQVNGLLWKDGGPVIGAQLENEYGLHGPGKGAEHILKLKQLAIAAGIDVPLYSVTGWPSLDFPPHDVIPVSGGYPDGFWFGSLTDLPPSMNYLFNLDRKLGDMGATVPSNDPTGKVDLRHDPYFGAEEAGGMASAYHRRPLLMADDIAALTLTGIGSGLNLYGYYMFHGGSNPHGRLTTLQESTASGYPNDLPEFNYDFQAPIGEYGEIRESYRKTRMLHLFVNAFGADLAPMDATGPSRSPQNAADTSVPRVALRARGDSGFLFVNNYVRQLQMPERRGFQARIKLPDETISVPEAPITVPANSYFCWPVNLDLDGARLRYSTAQLLTRLSTPSEDVFVFFAIPAIPAQFSFDARTVRSVDAPGQAISRNADSIRIEGVRPGSNNSIETVSKAGRRVRIIVLSESEAESATVLRLHDTDHLLLSSSQIFADENTLHLRSTDRGLLSFRVFPALHAAAQGAAKTDASKDGGWTDFRFDVPEATVPLTWNKVKDAHTVGPVKMGPPFSWRNGAVAAVPPENAFDAAAAWQLSLTQPLPAGVSDLWLNIDYVGDIGRLYIGPTLVDDDFFNGTRWQIGFKRYLPDALTAGAKITILPLRGDAPIYLDPRVRPAIARDAQVATIKSLTAKPEYEVVVTLKDN